MGDLLTAYVPFVGKNRAEDGSYVVYGKAAGPDLDLEGDVLDPAWLSKAMPAWFGSGANVREMHTMSAAGVGTEIEQLGDDWWVSAKIVDPTAIAKCEAGVYRGFSVGIKGAQVVREKAVAGARRRVVGGWIPEVSLADRPVNPTTLFAMAKAVDVGDSLRVPEGMTIADVYDAEHKLVRVDTEIDVSKAAEIDEDDDVLVVGEISKNADSGAEGEPIDNPPVDGDAPPAVDADLAGFVDRLKAARADAPTIEHVIDRLHAIGTHVETQLVVGDDGKAVHSPAALAAVRDGIAKLMQAELDELMAGEPEIGDLYDLLCTLQYFMAWWCNEARNGEDPDPYSGEDTSLDLEGDVVELATVADLVKAASADDATDDDKNLLTELRSALGVPDAEQLTKAISSAVETAIKPLADDLAQVKSTAAPTGVVTARAAAADLAKAATVDEQAAKAEGLRRAAYATNDPELRRGYLAKAVSIERDLVLARS